MKTYDCGLSGAITRCIAGVVCLGLISSVCCGSPYRYGLISTSTPARPTLSLAPNDRGYVQIETTSGSTRCSLNAEIVVCQSDGDGWPLQSDGLPYHCASVTALGDLHWFKADLGELKDRITLEYGTYRAQGWTNAATTTGTTFTNDRSGHGMFVRAEELEAF